MKTKMLAVKDLHPGMTIGEPVLSPSGKTLLGKDIIITERAISLLKMWDVNYIYVADSSGNFTEEEPDIEPDSQQDGAEEAESDSLTNVFSKFYQDYDSIIGYAAQSFEFVRNEKQVPVQELKDTSFSIYSTVLSTGSAIMDYLLVSDYDLADQISRHSVMVAFISSVIGRQMKLPIHDIQNLVLSGLLHDVGKFVIAKQAAAGPIDHIVQGGKLLRNVDDMPQEVIISILQHHECMDGTGVPMAKHGDKIHLFARIISVADIFHEGAYQGECANPFPVLTRIAKDKYSKLDPLVCQPFIDKVKDSLINSPVLLNDGRTAKVVFFTNEDFEHPIVKTTSGALLDLSNEKNLKIERILAQPFLMKAPPIQSRQRLLG